MDYNATQNAIDLGITSLNYNFLMGLSGLFVGFLFVFGLIITITDIAKGR